MQLFNKYWKVYTSSNRFNKLNAVRRFHRENRQQTNYSRDRCMATQQDRGHPCLYAAGKHTCIIQTVGPVITRAPHAFSTNLSVLPPYNKSSSSSSSSSLITSENRSFKRHFPDQKIKTLRLLHSTWRRSHFENWVFEFDFKAGKIIKHAGSTINSDSCGKIRAG